MEYVEITSAEILAKARELVGNGSSMREALIEATPHFWENGPNQMAYLKARDAALPDEQPIS